MTTMTTAEAHEARLRAAARPLKPKGHPSAKSS
jgi:hypothetical protein